MSKPSRFPRWLIGGTLTWLVYVITLSILHLILLKQWGVSFSIKLYSLDPTEPSSLLHAVVIGMLFPGLSFLDMLSFLHIHVSWLDAAIYNWGKLAFISSIPAFIVGALLLAQDRRLKLIGSILGLLLLGGSLLFVMNGLYSQ